MSERRARFWRLGPISGGYSPTTNGAGENAGWTFWLFRGPRLSIEAHRTSKVQTQRNAGRVCHSVYEVACGTWCLCDKPKGHDGPHYDRQGVTWNDRDAA